MVTLLDQTAQENAVANGFTDGVDHVLTWSKTLPVGVSKTEHYQGFTETVEIGRQKIYDATKRLNNLSYAA